MQQRGEYYRMYESWLIATGTTGAAPNTTSGIP
jgi:hypothetical protein